MSTLRALCAATAVAVVAGCGEVIPPSPTPLVIPPSDTPSQRSPSPAPSAGMPSVTPDGPAIGDPAGVAIELQLVVDGLDEPLFATGAGDDSGRLFVVEKGGRIRIVRDRSVQRGSFLDVNDRVSNGGEQGLLGLAFPPGFGATQNHLWVHYSGEGGDTVVASFRVSDDEVDLRSESIALSLDQPYSNHNGGWIAFGPDGMLYVALGDGGSGGDPHGNGQAIDTMLGKLLRIDVLGVEPAAERAYRVPPDNPFAGDIAGRGEIWSYGLRNPWRASFDRLTGDLWIGDVGQNAYEEVNRALATDGLGRGSNYGWNVTEGRHCFEPESGCDTNGITLPIAEYSHDFGCTVIGGYVYRGTASPALAGVYLFADICSGLIWGLASGGPTEQEPVLLLESGRQISSFGEDDAGELYLTDLGAGELYRIVGVPRG
jgi:glucose/arabinose dehydrogenase